MGAIESINSNFWKSTHMRHRFWCERSVVPSRLRDFYELTKPRMNLFVVITTLVGYFVAAKGPVDWTRLATALIGTALTAAGASVLNQLIERKAFSWTRVLENLEKVMPPRVHLESISPQLDEDNQLGLKMTVAGDSRDRALELARRMEESRRFAQTRVEAGHAEQSQTGDTERFDIVAIYIPEQIVPAAPAAEPKAETKSKTGATPKAGIKPKTTAPAGGKH